MSWHHLDELMWHNKQHVEFARVVVVVPLSLNAVASSDNKHIELGNLQHHILLVISIEARIALLVKRPMIFNVFDDVLVLNASITVDIEFFFNVLIVIDFDDALDFEHTDEQVLEELDFDLMLDDDERSILQLDDGLVDLVNRDDECDRPPLG